MTARVLLAAALLLVPVLPAAAQSVSLTLRDGRVTLITQNATPAAILAEWARLGQVKVVDGERVPGAPLTLRLENVPEREALDIVLRSAAGYIAAPQIPGGGEQSLSLRSRPRHGHVSRRGQRGQACGAPASRSGGRGSKPGRAARARPGRGRGRTGPGGSGRRRRGCGQRDGGSRAARFVHQLRLREPAALLRCAPGRAAGSRSGSAADRPSSRRPVRSGRSARRLPAQGWSRSLSQDAAGDTRG